MISSAQNHSVRLPTSVLATRTDRQIHAFARSSGFSTNTDPTSPLVKFIREHVHDMYTHSLQRTMYLLFIRDVEGRNIDEERKASRSSVAGNSRICCMNLLLISLEANRHIYLLSFVSSNLSLATS